MSARTADGGAKLHLSGLNARAREFDILSQFSQYGSVKDVDIAFFKSGPRRGMPRGFAFVTMGSRDEAKAAQRAMDGATFLGQAITVRFEAKEMVFAKGGNNASGAPSTSREFRTADEKARDAQSHWKSHRIREREHKLAGLARLSDKVMIIEAKLAQMDRDDAARAPLDLGGSPAVPGVAAGHDSELQGDGESRASDGGAE